MIVLSRNLQRNKVVHICSWASHTIWWIAAIIEKNNISFTVIVIILKYQE